MPVRAILGVEAGALITATRSHGIMMNAWVAMDPRGLQIGCDIIGQFPERMPAVGDVVTGHGVRLFGGISDGRPEFLSQLIDLSRAISRDRMGRWHRQKAGLSFHQAFFVACWGTREWRGILG